MGNCAQTKYDNSEVVVPENKMMLAVAADKSQLGVYFTASSGAATPSVANTKMPQIGLDAMRCKDNLDARLMAQNNPYLNTSSYVNVFFEDEEKYAALKGLELNLADGAVYPLSTQLHNECVNMIANLWNAPVPLDFAETKVFNGAGTVGSTEACLLSGLCLKFRWREWIKKKKGLSKTQVLGVVPNIVISTMYQACWEKFFRYMDVEARLVPVTKQTFVVTPEEVKKKIDENTIGVVCILGNHYGGQYDPVWEVDKMLQELNKQKGWQVGIHVDGASGGFIAPFQADLPAWDFRCPTVLSISASGHKFGESCCGTGWVIWRERKGLSEHVAISVSYLGGSSDSYTLNFSRPASGVYVQFYKFHRLGLNGYQSKVDNQMQNAKYLRDQMKAMKNKEGKLWFTMLDAGDTKDLPVVAAQLNRELKLPYNDIDLQHVISAYSWYVCGYSMSFTDPNTEEKNCPLFSDAPPSETMMRVVMKSNITRAMTQQLAGVIESALNDLTGFGDTFSDLNLPWQQRHHNRKAC